MAVKGNLNIEIDEAGIEARITITPDAGGAELTAEVISALLAEKNIRVGVDAAAVDRAIRAAAKKKGEPVTFVAASGTAPQPGLPESILFEPCPVPPRLSAVARRVLEAAPRPRGFRLREERVKTQKKVLRKAPLPFLPPREEVEVQVEKRMVREDADIDPTVTEQGYVTQGSLVARVRPGTAGKPGRSVFGRAVPAPRPESGGTLVLDGLTRSGSEVKAAVTGFLRRGSNWCDVVPFRDHSISLAASRDGLTCLLTFRPGDRAAPAPGAKDVLDQAAKIGFSAPTLMPAHEIEDLMQDAVLRGAPLEAVSITPTVNGLAVVTVSPDKLSAVLYLRKGRGGGKPLSPAAVSEAIRASRVKGFNPDTVRKDLAAFFGGRAVELADYPLASGRAAKPGSEPKIQWRAMFLPEAEAMAIREAVAASAGAYRGLASLDAFPPGRVEAVARVKKDEEVVRILPSTGGEPGVDVYGATISPARPAAAEFRLFEGLEMRSSAVVTTGDGILEKGTDGKLILLRVRPHRDADVEVVISPDRMRATLSYRPPLGDGARPSAEEVRGRIELAGVRNGMDEKRLAELLGRIARREEFVEQAFAAGRPARREERSRIDFHVALATGRAVSLRADGTADYRAQDRITRVRKGQRIATVRPRDPRAEDGWDVTGLALPLPPEEQETLSAGRGVREELLTDGSLLYVSERDGELVRDGPVLSVTDSHFVRGDVDMSTGNVSFSGVVRIGGSVRSGFKVSAGGPLEVEGMVEGALCTAEGSIAVGEGIKGEGRAILRSQRDIASLFAEQSVLLAIGNIRLKGSCVRCQVKCNGRLILDSEKGSLMAGEVRASRGVEVQNIGAPSGVRTLVSFGQDFLVRDQIEREEREVGRLEKQVADLDAEMFVLERRASEAAAAAGRSGAQSQAGAMLSRARTQKLQAMKQMETRKMRLITLRDRYDEHVASEVVVRGTLYPGAVLESHGRRYETNIEKNMITLRFDPVAGKIVEKL